MSTRLSPTMNNKANRKKNRKKQKKTAKARKWVKRIVLFAALIWVVWFGFTFYYAHVFPIASVLDDMVLKDVQVHAGTYTPLSEIPDTLKQAIIATEDRRFETDPGIDPFGMARSLFTDVKTKSYTEGGSTLTQQLIRNVLLTQTKSMTRKIKEIILSVATYQHVSKAQVLEYYLNDVYFGSGAYGVEQASRVYFGQPLHSLNEGQLTMLAGLPNAPSLINPFVSIEAARERQRVVLDNLVQTNVISQKQADEWYLQPLHLQKK